MGWVCRRGTFVAGVRLSWGGFVAGRVCRGEGLSGVGLSRGGFVAGRVCLGWVCRCTVCIFVPDFRNFALEESQTRMKKRLLLP